MNSLQTPKATIKDSSDGYPVVRWFNTDTGRFQENKVKQLLQPGDSNTKLNKNDIKTFGLSLSPSTESGYGNTCASASKGCKGACLDHQGLASVFSRIREARKAKTVLFYTDRPRFLAMLEKEIRTKIKTGKTRGHDIAFRLNVFSDIRWEKYLPADLLCDNSQNFRFYDYSKHYKRVLKSDCGYIRPNYHLTFSRSETNESETLNLLDAGNSAAVVFARVPLPKTWNGFPVIDGDKTDLRYLDDSILYQEHLQLFGGFVVGLKLKGASNDEKRRAINSGFAIDNTGGIVQDERLVLPAKEVNAF